MTIPFDNLIELLTKYGHEYFQDVSPREALYISYPSERRAVKTITYQTADDGTLAIDVNDDGVVLGIEML